MNADTDMPEGAPAEAEEGSDERESTLVPASLFGGDCKIGDTYTVKVVGKYEDELAIEHVPDAREEKPAADTLAAADEGIEMMADKGQDY